MLLREMQLLHELRHPHIVQIFDAFMPEQDPDAIYIVMELCDSDLANVCANLKGISARQARKLVYNLLVGCDYLHTRGVYHRDLKPANCLANRDCTVKICDFNLATASATPGRPSLVRQ